MDWKIARPLRREIRVRYPADAGRMVLRTDLDWDRDLEADRVEEDGTLHVFVLESDRPFHYVKPCLRRRDELHWAVGANILVLMTEPGLRTSYPHFFSGGLGEFTEVREIFSEHLSRPLRMRAYLPPGYHENTLCRYRVAYMQDGQNLFLPDEAFLGMPWDVDATLKQLNEMNAIDDFIVAGLHSGDRMNEYTKPGYEAYGRAVVEEVMPRIESRLRTRGQREDTLVMGSSLGGVVSFYLAWQYPEKFIAAACMSSTFTFKDDLIDRVYAEPKKPVGFYLDSGWPGDNYEVTLAMATALIQRGWSLGRDLMHFSFPLDTHDEKAWGRRLHLPTQVFARSLRDLNVAHHGYSIGAEAREAAPRRPVKGRPPAGKSSSARTNRARD